jgi:hypothetical protein
VTLDDALIAQAKEFAVRHHRTFNSVLEDALRELLQRHILDRSDGRQIDLVWFTGDGLMPGVDLDSSASLHELLDEDDRSPDEDDRL